MSYRISHKKLDTLQSLASQNERKMSKMEQKSILVNCLFTWMAYMENIKIYVSSNSTFESIFLLKKSIPLYAYVIFVVIFFSILYDIFLLNKQTVTEHKTHENKTKHQQKRKYPESMMAYKLCAHIHYIHIYTIYINNLCGNCTTDIHREENKSLNGVTSIDICKFLIDYINMYADVFNQ